MLIVSGMLQDDCNYLFLTIWIQNKLILTLCIACFMAKFVVVALQFES